MSAIHAEETLLAERLAIIQRSKHLTYLPYIFCVHMSQLFDMLWCAQHADDFLHCCKNACFYENKLKILIYLILFRWTNVRARSEFLIFATYQAVINVQQVIGMYTYSGLSQIKYMDHSL